MPLHLQVPEPQPRLNDLPISPTRVTSETYNDKYVVLYDFGSTGAFSPIGPRTGLHPPDSDPACQADYDVAAKEFNALLHSLEAAGLHVEVRPGYDQTIMLFVKAPRQLLGNRIYKSRVRDWLYGITQARPEGDKNTVVSGAFEAEDLLTMYHLVQWPQSMGGAGITPGVGEWKNVKCIFPLHNDKANQLLLRYLSRRLLLTTEDLDKIRNLFGSKVAFYFAFIQTYFVFLTFPAITGVLAWLFLPKYSLSYAILTVVWCTVFLEYWKVREADLRIRWDVRGVNKTKVNRSEFKYEQIIQDEAGRPVHYFPKWKQITRQMLQIPFIIISAVALGVMISAVFAIEVLLSDSYDGPYQFYLEYLPTIIFAGVMPYITSCLEGVAEWLTDFENHRTADYHEMSLTQKVFILNIITNYLPIFLTAFVYIPFGNDIVPWLESLLVRFIPSLEQKIVAVPFRLDSDRLQNEVIALTVTGQISSFFEENILPLLKHKMSGWYREYRRAYSKDAMLMSIVDDDEDEVEFLARCRNEATLPSYNVQDDIAELVLQFGYLALFSPVWPLIPMGFLINNWIELRSDFAKICMEHQRPAPTRAEGIGPWVVSLQILVWLGSISSAAIVHLFGSDGKQSGSWATLPITIFISEHILLLLAAVTRAIFNRLGSEQIRRERNERYARRRKVLDEFEANKRAGLHLDVDERARRKSILVTGNETFWTKQVEDGASAVAGMRLMNLAKQWEESHGHLKKE